MKREPPPTPRGRATLALAGSVLALLVYANSLSGGFTFDDPYIARDDPFLTEGRLLDAFGRAYWPQSTRTEVEGREVVVPLPGASREETTYRPLTTVTYAVNRRVFGPGPFPFHLVNVLVHAIVTWLVFLLARRVLRTEEAAVGVAVLFAVHPIHVEAVAGIVGRAELLAAAAWVGALVLADAAPRATPLAVRAGGVFALTLAGSLAKETAATLPIALGVLLAYRGRLRTRGAAILLGAGAAAWIPLLALRTAALGGAFQGAFQGASWTDGSAAVRLLGAFGALTHYAGVFGWPRILLADVPVALVLPSGWSDPRALVGIVLATVAVGAGLRVLLGKGSLLALGVALAAVAYLPVSHLAFPVNVIAADRLFYLPSVGAALVAGAGFERMRSSAARGARRVAAVAFAVALVLLGARTVVRNRDWASDTTLFASLVRAVPDSARAWARLGQLRRDAGRVSEARECWEHALALDPGEAAAMHGLGWLAAESDTPEGYSEALEWFRRLAEANPTEALPLADAGRVHLRGGSPARAIDAFRAALEREAAHAPSAQGLVDSYLALAVAEARAGHLREAERSLAAGLDAASSSGADASRLREMLAEVRSVRGSP